MRNPLKRGSNAGLRYKGGLFIHHPRIPGAFIQLPTARNKPVPFRDEYRLLKPENAVRVE